MLSNEVKYHCSCIMINNLIPKNEGVHLFACFVKVMLHYDCMQHAGRGVGHLDTSHMQHCTAALHCTAGTAGHKAVSLQAAMQHRRCRHKRSSQITGGAC